MADAHQIVKAMAAESAKGRTPSLLGQFLREQSGRVEGWFARWLSKPLTYDVCSIELFEDRGFFHRSCVFQIFANDRVLEGSVVPGGGTFGLFSLGQDGLRYLNHRKDNLEELLRQEGRALNECAPTVLASLVAEALGRERNSSHAVLESLEHLATYQGDPPRPDVGYDIDVRELNRVQSVVADPKLSGDVGSGWQLEFCSLFGWMHVKQALVRHHYRFAPGFQIEHQAEVLSRKIFKRTPDIMY
jgi:hypothetical protein